MDLASRIVPMMRKRRDRAMMRGIVPSDHQFVTRGLKVISVLGTGQIWLSYDILCDVQLKTTYQQEYTAYLALVDIDFLEP